MGYLILFLLVWCGCAFVWLIHESAKQEPQEKPSKSDFVVWWHFQDFGKLKSQTEYHGFTPCKCCASQPFRFGYHFLGDWRYPTFENSLYLAFHEKPIKRARAIEAKVNAAGTVSTKPGAYGKTIWLVEFSNAFYL